MTALVCLVFLIPIGVFVGTFFWMERQLAKRLTNPDTITGNHIIGSLVVAAIAGFIVFLGVYLLSFELDAIVQAQSIQRALDEQCGAGRFVADADGYSGDPFPSWSGYDGKVSCVDYDGDGWNCGCPTPTPSS